MICSLCKRLKRRNSGIASPIPKSSDVKEFSLTQANRIDIPNKRIRAHHEKKEKHQKNYNRDIQFIEFRNEMVELMEKKLEEHFLKVYDTLKEGLKNDSIYFSKK